MTDARARAEESPAPHVVRRPWLPECLVEHDFTPDTVTSLSYIVVDEIVDGMVGLVVSGWPSADGLGRLRFDAPDHEVEVGVPLRRLRSDVYRHEQDMTREPRIGDVFAAVLSEDVRKAADGEPIVWDRPLTRLVGEHVYDVTDEARKVAKLAFFGATARVLAMEEAEVRGLAEDGVLKDAARPEPPHRARLVRIKPAEDD